MTATPRTPDVLGVIRTRTVVRQYTAEPVSDATVRTLVAAMTAAPSASNLQAWAFVVVRDQARVRSVRAFAPGMVGRPALVLVACLDHSGYGEEVHPRQVGRLCVAMAVQNFLLAAHALGLGACPASSFLAAPIRLLLDMPPHLEPVLLVSAGYPAVTSPPSPPSPRRALHEVVHHDGCA
ncbi:nitroreductase family protein [Nonomuraea sp. NPDC002799]